MRLLTRLWFSQRYMLLSTCGLVVVWEQWFSCLQPSARGRYQQPHGLPSPHLCVPSGQLYELDTLYLAAGLLQPENTHKCFILLTTSRLNSWIARTAVPPESPKITDIQCRFPPCSHIFLQICKIFWWFSESLCLYKILFLYPVMVSICCQPTNL